MPLLEDITFHPNRPITSWWDSFVEDKPYIDTKQAEMEFLWPHRGVQLDLSLDTKNCDTRASLMVPNSYLGPWGTISPNPPLSVSVAPTNIVGQLNIGSIQIGIEKKPKWYQRVLYKLLGFNWNEK